MSRWWCSCSGRRLEGRQQLVSQLLQVSKLLLQLHLDSWQLLCTDLQSVSLPLIEYLVLWEQEAGRKISRMSLQYFDFDFDLPAMQI